LLVNAGDSSWTVARRYRQFSSVNAKILDILPNKIHFPSKTLLTDKLDKHLVEKRKKKLQTWLDEIVTVPAVLTHPAFILFVDPNELVRDSSNIFTPLNVLALTFPPQATRQIRCSHQNRLAL